jgi:ubiquitin-protein ligase
MSTSDFKASFSNKNKLDSITRHRIQRDLNEINTHTNYSPIIFVNKIDDDLLHLEAAISGPMSTPYENGIFLLDIKLHDQYPVR